MDRKTLEGACTSTERIVARVRPDQMTSPTPCVEWDVRAVLNHVVGTLHLGAALLADSASTVNMAPGDLPDADVVGDDPMKAYRVGVEALLAAATADALERPHTTPFGEMPGAVVAGFTAVDVLVHGWDLARATGQDATLPDELAEAVLGFARQTLTDETRAPRIGPEIALDATASATDRLVGYLGRRP